MVSLLVTACRRDSAGLRASVRGVGWARSPCSLALPGVRLRGPLNLGTSQVKGRAVKIRPKTRDWLRGWQAQVLRRRESAASVSPTAGSRLLEESFDFTSLDYESEGELAGSRDGSGGSSE